MKENTLNSQKEEKPPFGQTIRSFLEKKDRPSLLRENEEKKVPPCGHRRRHLVKTKKGVEIRLLCKDSKLIYQLRRPIKVNPITINDCYRCEVPEIEARLKCPHLGFEKLSHLGLLVTRFYCVRNKKIILSPLEECTRCPEVKYFA